MAKTKEPRIIPLTKGMVAIISAEDYRRVNRHRWYTHTSRDTKKKPGQPYARATINGRKVYLHRFVMETPDYEEADHRNHQTLDCRRENLENVAPKINKIRRRCCLKKKTVDKSGTTVQSRAAT